MSQSGLPSEPDRYQEAVKDRRRWWLGRKNWLFLGSVGSSYRTARLMTLVSIAIRNDLDVKAYLEAILVRLVGGDTDYESMLPHVWAAALSGHIRAHRPTPAPL
ncbi:MAG: hypothetical protein R3C05_13580 [Pirellulaceae bacterium]